MISKKELQKQVDDLTSEVKELSKIVVTDELKTLREKEKLYEEQTKLLSNVKFRVKSAKVVDDGSGAPNVVVIYQLPIITIPLDEKGDPSEKIPFFYSVNALGMVSIEDYQTIEKALIEAKKMANNNINKK